MHHAHFHAAEVHAAEVHAAELNAKRRVSPVPSFRSVGNWPARCHGGENSLQQFASAPWTRQILIPVAIKERHYLIVGMRPQDVERTVRNDLNCMN